MCNDCTTTGPCAACASKYPSSPGVVLVPPPIMLPLPDYDAPSRAQTCRNCGGSGLCVVCLARRVRDLEAEVARLVLHLQLHQKVPYDIG